MREYTGGPIPAPALVYVYVDWCGYCKKATPMVQRVANQFGGSLSVIKINGDRFTKQQISRILGGTEVSYPTIVFIDRAGRVHRFEQQRSPESITSFVCHRAAKLCGNIGAA